MRRLRAKAGSILALNAVCLCAMAGGQPPFPDDAEPESQPASQPATVDAPVQPTARSAYSTATKPERDVMAKLLAHSSWARRAIATLRLERYGCEDSRQLLLKSLVDPAWQVRAFALRALVRRGDQIDPTLIAEEAEPRVVRTALRYRQHFEKDKLARGVRVLARSSNLEDKMLAVELAAASGDADLLEIAKETCKSVILKMDRVEGGVLSPRLAAVTGQKNLRKHFEWKDWILKTGRRFAVGPAYALDEGEGAQSPSLIAQLEGDEFAGIESYMNTLGSKELDLAILLDCTASMAGEIAAAQGGVDDLMRFVGDMVSSARIAVVAYRDRSDEWETQHWDFTSDLGQARTALWSLSADGGGDFPEAVFPAMRLAFTKLNWRKDSTKVLVLVGDAPPHIGYGANCVEMAERARAGSQMTTHAIQAEGKPVKHFDEIAKAGGGRCVSLEDDDGLMAEITGLTLADRYEAEFREFFQVYLELCR